MNKMHYKQTWPLLLITFLLSGLWALPAFATSRTVYFTAGGKNYTPHGLATHSGGSGTNPDVASTCKIVLSNPSQQGQTWTLNYTVQSQDQFAGSTTWTSAGSSCGASPCTGTLAAGASTTITFTYTTFTPGVVGSQFLRCSGSIIAQDQTSSPGFMFATGTLVTFTEASSIVTDAATGGTATFGGNAVYSSIPIVINRAKPF